MKHRIRSLAVLALVVATACKKEEPAPVYEAVAIGKRDIIVTAQAAGAINPDTIVDVKSRASGEITDLAVETGQLVRRGALLARVDRRVPQNRVSQAEAAAEVATARLRNAEAQLRRAKELFASRAITEQELETTTLDVANSKASVISSTIDLENAKIALEDTEVRAPINGTIIAKNVERGTVISSPVSDVGGGTVLLKMADLTLVQVKTFVDETDIGKLRVGLEANVTVDAYPNRPFKGELLKIEPQADTIQNVTMFPVLVRIDNKDGLLKPGMSANVRIGVGERRDVIAVPNAALRTERDVASAAAVLGLGEADFKTMLEAAKAAAAPPAGTPSPDGALELQGKGGAPTDAKPAADPKAAATPGAAGQRGGAGGQTGRGGAGGQMGGRGGRGGGNSDAFSGGTYIVFVQREGKPTPVYIKTGLTDLDYSEVKSGLKEGDMVLMLPSASLIQGQQNLQNRMKSMSGGLPGQSNTAAPAAGGAGKGGATPAAGGAKPGGR
ncbi:MAG: efflux RND transporter periplasmic adaptor subunit [Gemmatimonadales bacterium]|nr:efflux RND transporter periplasmic adaptor subunit [Gemmatimonadales bacterium]